MTQQQKITDLVRWFADHGPNLGATDQEMDALWLAKVMEELGEVAEAFVGATGFNPRKGRTHTLSDVQKELLDVAVTALCAFEHLNGGEAMRNFIEHLDKAHSRIGTTADPKAEARRILGL